MRIHKQPRLMLGQKVSLKTNSPPPFWSTLSAELNECRKEELVLAKASHSYYNLVSLSSEGTLQGYRKRNQDTNPP